MEKRVEAFLEYGRDGAVGVYQIGEFIDDDHQPFSVGHEVKRPFAAHELLDQPGLAYPQPSVDRHELEPFFGMTAFEKSKFFPAVNKSLSGKKPVCQKSFDILQFLSMTLVLHSVFQMKSF
jgi:hypothetical protein